MLRQAIPTGGGISTRRTGICLKMKKMLDTLCSYYGSKIFILIEVCIVITKCDLPFYRMHLFLLSLLQQHLPQSALVLVERRLFACHEIFSYVVLTDSWTVPESHISDTMK